MKYFLLHIRFVVFTTLLLVPFCVQATLTANQIFEKAVESRDLRLLDDARVYFQTALRLYQVDGNKKQSAITLVEIGEIEYLQIRNLESINALTEALYLFRELKFKPGEAKVLLRLGDLNRRLSKSEDSKKNYENALLIFKSLSNSIGEANTLFGLGELERKSGQNAIARKYFEDAYRIHKTLGDRLGEANALWGIAGIEFSLGSIEKARKLFYETRLLYKSINERQGEAHVLWKLADLEQSQDNYAEARKIYEEAIRLFQVEKNRIGEANVLVGLGHLEFVLKRSDEARRRFTDALRLFREGDNPLGIANSLSSLGDLDRIQGRTEVARTQVETALKIYISIQHPLGQANAYLILGELDKQLGHSEESRRHLELALLMYRADQNALGEANVLESLANLDASLGRSEEAKINYRDAGINFGLAGLKSEQRKMEMKSMSTVRWLVAFGFDNWMKILLGVLLIIIGVLGFFVKPQKNKKSATLISNNNGRKWLTYTSSQKTSVVYVHGIFSNPDAFYNSISGIKWPELLETDDRLDKPNVYLGQFYTSADSGQFDITQAVEDMRVQLTSPSTDGKPAPLDSENIIFIAHSTGGLVIRDLLTRRPELFKERKIGLVLVASPSRGSDWANRLKVIINASNNKMANQLQKGNEVVTDLDRRFADFVSLSNEQRGFELRGVDLYENRFVLKQKILGLFVSTKTVVVSERDSASYFGAGRIVPDTDHFSIAKPDNIDHPSHRYLVEFWLNKFIK